MTLPSAFFDQIKARQTLFADTQPYPFVYDILITFNEQASLYVKLKASPLDRGPEQAVHLLKESLHTPGKGLDLHTA
jgi:hypothetical protein